MGYVHRNASLGELTGPEPIRLFKYHPDNDRLVIFDKGLPRLETRRQLLKDPGEKSSVSAVLAETRHKGLWILRFDGV